MKAAVVRAFGKPIVTEDVPVPVLRRTGGGAQGVLVTAVSTAAFSQAAIFDRMKAGNIDRRLMLDIG
jgi:hypothetical protein